VAAAEALATGAELTTDGGAAGVAVDDEQALSSITSAGPTASAIRVRANMVFSSG
jgi:hypothetical protein